jgi:hypothetical protein
VHAPSAAFLAERRHQEPELRQRGEVTGIAVVERVEPRLVQIEERRRPRLPYRLHQRQRAGQHQPEHLRVEPGMVGQEPATGEAGAPADRQRPCQLRLGEGQLPLPYLPEERAQRPAGRGAGEEGPGIATERGRQSVVEVGPARFPGAEVDPAAPVVRGLQPGNPSSAAGTTEPADRRELGQVGHVHRQAICSPSLSACGQASGW